VPDYTKRHIPHFPCISVVGFLLEDGRAIVDFNRLK